MKLLFDANLSPALVKLLEADFPGSAHVRAIGLQAAPDSQIWDHANSVTFVCKLLLPNKACSRRRNGQASAAADAWC